MGTTPTTRAYHRNIVMIHHLTNPTIPGKDITRRVENHQSPPLFQGPRHHVYDTHSPPSTPQRLYITTTSRKDPETTHTPSAAPNSLYEPDIRQPTISRYQGKGITRIQNTTTRPQPATTTQQIKTQPPDPYLQTHSPRDVKRKQEITRPQGKTPRTQRATRV